jgi:4-hydroxybenzoate polyprenyltransferase
MDREEIMTPMPKLGVNNNFLPKMSRFGHVMRLLRYKQWTKNGFIFSGALISFTQMNISMIEHAMLAFLLFCGISSCVYIINDIADIEADRLHPVKKLRPLPAGDIKLHQALVILFILGPCMLLLAFQLHTYFGAVILGYFVLNLFYSFKLKRYVLIDVIIISIGFVLRALAGCLVTSGEVPIWFLLSIAFLTLFLGFNKRRKEILTLADHSRHTRKSLNEYSIGLLNEIIPMLAACSILTYSCFIINETHSKYLIVTIPLVLYGILRYQYLSNKTEFGESPELVLLRDKPMRLILLLWLIAYVSLQSSVIDHIV